jgi:hypothetical protein
LQLASPRQFSLAAINIQSHNPTLDFDAGAKIVLQVDSFVNTAFSDSTLTVAGTATGNGSGFSLTTEGPGTVAFTWQLPRSQQESPY